MDHEHLIRHESLLCVDCSVRLMYRDHRLACPRCHGTVPIVDGMVIVFSIREQPEHRDGHAELYTTRFSRDFLYKKEKDLKTRVNAYDRYFTLDFPDKALIEHRLNSESARIIDIGCGVGKPLLPVGPTLFSDLDIRGLDVSLSVLQEARRNMIARDFSHLLINATAERLPFPDSYFDVVLARHMLYHVGGIEQACREIHRVLRPDGILLATTNSEQGKRELFALYEAAVEKIACLNHVKRGATRFSQENGATILRTVFQRVETFEWQGYFDFMDTATALEYYMSTPYYKKSCEDEEGQRQHRVFVKQHIDSQIERIQSFRVHNKGAAFLAQKS